MRRVLNTKEAIDNALRVLIHSGKRYRTQKWQANLIEETEMVEVNNIFLTMEMADQDTILGSNILADLTGADMPWAEDHFNERLAGPSNPGEQYKNWPYCPDFSSYLDPARMFSHTYQERFWPPKVPGIRFMMGDWNDVKNRLASDTSSRQAFLSIWHPEDQSNNDVRVPCSIGYWFKINGGFLDITYLIRSCDARRHFRNDVYMAQRLAKDMAVHLNRTGHGIRLGRMSMWIGSFHCFEPDIYAIRKQLK